MRSFLMVVAAAAFLAAGTSAIRAQGEFPLKYVLAEANDPLPRLGIGYFMGAAEQPPQIKALPNRLSPNRRYFGYFGVSLDGKRLLAVLEMSSSPKLYVDLAGTGDFSSVAPLVGTAKGDECRFGPIDVPVGDKKTAITAKVLFVSVDNNQFLGGRAAGYVAGDVKLDGQTYRVAVLDKNLDGRYESAFGAGGQREPSWRADAIAIDSDQDGKFTGDMDSGEIMPLSKAVCVKGKYYRVEVVLNGPFIRLEKYEPKMGTLDVGIAASLKVFSDTGLHNLGGPGGKWQVPEGKYLGESLSISKIDADGKEWLLEHRGLLGAGPLENFEIRGGETTAFKIGPPLTLKVDARQPESGQIRLDLALAGRGGETYSVGLQKGTSRLPTAKVKVFDASGKLLAEGNSEYG